MNNIINQKCDEVDDEYLDELASETVKKRTKNKQTGLLKYLEVSIFSQNSLETRKPKGLWHSCQHGNTPSELSLLKY